jgi:hypothetical protein
MARSVRVEGASMLAMAMAFLGRADQARVAMGRGRFLAFKPRTSQKKRRLNARRCA